MSCNWQFFTENSSELCREWFYAPKGSGSFGADKKHQRYQEPLMLKESSISCGTRGYQFSRHVKLISPSFQDTSIEPPYCWQMDSAMDRPMPYPPLSELCEESSR